MPSSIAIAKSLFLSWITLDKISKHVRLSLPPLKPTATMSFFVINLLTLMFFLTFFSKYSKKHLLQTFLGLFGSLITGFIRHSLHGIEMLKNEAIKTFGNRFF